VTQPLDAGVTSVFKRKFLEMLSQETNIVRNHNKEEAITNGHAWSFLPYAWNHDKASIIRQCFAQNTSASKEDVRTAAKVPLQ
jgi:hypothetical protein